MLIIRVQERQDRMYSTLKILLPRLCIVALLTIILGIGCKEQNSPKLANLTGVVQLINNTDDVSLTPGDFSGVTISLYAEALADTALQRLNQKYPQIGVPYSQMTNFDHRNSNPIATANSGGDGSFKLEGIPTGKYNLVISKPGWGVKYLFGKTLLQGENTLDASEGEYLLLHPVAEFAGVYSSNTFTFSAENDVVISNDVHFLEGTIVIINPEAKIWISPGKKLTFYGEVRFGGTIEHPISINSDYAMYSHAQTEVSGFEAIVFAETASLGANGMHGVIVSNINSGLIARCNSFKLHDSYISGIDGAVLGINNNIFEINRSVLRSRSQTPNYLVNLSGVASASVKNSVIFHSSYGLYATNTNALAIEKCYIISANRCIYLNNYVNTQIRNNEFVSGDMAILTFLGINSDIRLNNIIAPNGVVYRSYLNIGPIHDNNFYCTNYAIDFHTNSAYLGHLPATQNWWGTTDDAQIQILIRDKNDFPPTTPYYDTISYVDYTPFRSSKVTTAGIN